MFMIEFKEHINNNNNNIFIKIHIVLGIHNALNFYGSLPLNYLLNINMVSKNDGSLID